MHLSELRSALFFVGLVIMPSKSDRPRLTTGNRDRTRETKTDAIQNIHTYVTMYLKTEGVLKALCNC